MFVTKTMPVQALSRTLIGFVPGTRRYPIAAGRFVPDPVPDASALRRYPRTQADPTRPLTCSDAL